MSVGYPQFSPSARKGELGVQVVSRIINDFSWIFRRNHQETDFGIDGHVDIVTDDGFVTGQMFAVQIKYGESFFKEKSKWGYVYRGEKKHFNYMINYPCPVIIIVCQPDNQRCYWAAFDVSQTQQTGNGWKLTIPFDNELSSLSKDIIRNMLPPLVDGLSLLENYWASNDIIMLSDYIAYFVDKSEVDALETGHLRHFFDRIKATKELAYHCMGNIEIGFHGYDNDPRELFEIDEVRRYISIVDPIIPELFFFVRTKEPAYTLVLFVTSLSKITLPHGRNLTAEKKIRVEFEPAPLKGFLENHFIGLNKMTDWLGLSIDENKKITYAVTRHIFWDLPKELTGGV